MEKQNINDYFIMLGKIFEWICFDSNDAVELSAIYHVNNKAELKPSFSKSELCVATIMSSCKAYDKLHGTDYYEKFEFARINGVKH